MEDNKGRTALVQRAGWEPSVVLSWLCLLTYLRTRATGTGELGRSQAPRKSLWTRVLFPRTFESRGSRAILNLFLFFLFFNFKKLPSPGRGIMWQTFQVPSYGNTALCKWLGSNPIEHNKRKQSVLSPIALIFTTLMIPKTNEHGLKKERERRKRRKEERQDKTHSALLLPAFLAARAGAYCHHQQGPGEKLTLLLWGQSLHVKWTGHSHHTVPLLMMVNNETQLHP